MFSMTGFGKARVKTVSGWILVEISSVNRKQLEIFITLPREWNEFENEIRKLVAAAAVRGRVQVTLSYCPSNSTTAPRINQELAREYYSAFQKLRKQLGILGEPTFGDVIRSPGVVSADGKISVSQHWPAIKKAVQKTVQDWQTMRLKEGKHLLHDLNRRLRHLITVKERIACRSPQVIEAYRHSLQNKIKAANLNVDSNDENLRREILLFADRSDISEEMTRLDSHFKQFAACLKTGSGRKLEFILQEIQREVNTTGAKANDVHISHEVVDLKMEIEKIREQVQNIE